MSVAYLRDGDSLSVVVALEPSVFDPMLTCAYMSQSYRVVANSFGKVLELVPLAKQPVFLNEMKFPINAV